MKNYHLSTNLLQVRLNDVILKWPIKIGCKPIAVNGSLLVGLPGVLSLQARRHPRIDTGIPEAAFELECPDNQLKASVLQEFILIDDKHSERLNEFEETFESVLM